VQSRIGGYVREVDLKDHIMTPDGSEGRYATLESVAQDVHDMECLENELCDLCEHVEDQTSEKAFGLNLAIDAINLARNSLARGLCLMTKMAMDKGESTVVKIDDTRKKYIDVEAPEAEVELPITTKEVKGKN
jgi:hypothetical protein